MVKRQRFGCSLPEDSSLPDHASEIILAHRIRLQDNPEMSDTHCRRYCKAQPRRYARVEPLAESDPPSLPAKKNVDIGPCRRTHHRPCYKADQRRWPERAYKACIRSRSAWKLSPSINKPSMRCQELHCFRRRSCEGTDEESCVENKKGFAFKNSTFSGFEYPGPFRSFLISSMAKSRTHSSRWASFLAISG